MSRGSEFSPRSWGESGTYLSGGGWAVSSSMSHREFVLEWGATGSMDEAMTMQAFRDGAFSMRDTDLFYFHDPLSYERNVLPKAWAQPGLLGRQLGWKLTRSLFYAQIGYPTEIVEVPADYLADEVVSGPRPGVLYQIIPPGYDMWITTGVTDGMSMKPQLPNSTFGPEVEVASYGWSKVTTGQDESPARGVLLYPKSRRAGRTALLISARAVLLPEGSAQPAVGPQGFPEWMPGMGHSGCRFVGDPTYVPTGQFSGGLASFAVTLKEVGDWL